MPIGNVMRVPYSYLADQFASPQAILDDIAQVVRSGKFTLGPAVAEFEEAFAQLCGVEFAVGVACGTDAIILSLKALGVGPGDEVITAPNTFIATVGAIVAVGATPVFVEVGNDYNLDVSRVQAAITPKTKALLPVHLCGNPVDIEALVTLAEKNGLPLVEDACHAITASVDSRRCGSFGITGCFSLHPLKNLNVWGDGGIIVTRSREMRDRLRLLRNHGLSDRDTVEVFGVNSRLDTIQAAVGLHLLKTVDWITERRISNAARLDRGLSGLRQVRIPARDPRKRHVYHLYVIRVADRDALVKYLGERGVDAKVHYPVPLHLQKAAIALPYGPGSFPECETQAAEILSLPIHQHLTESQIGHVIACIREFYG